MHKRTCSFFPVFTLVLSVFFAFWAFRFPYTGDDWFWGSGYGTDLLGTFFQGYNGRYLGNLLVLVLTRNKLFDALFMAVCFTLICILSFRYAKEQHRSLYILSALLFLLLPRSIRAESIIWTSGFANYVPSALISIGYLFLVRNITDTDAPQYTPRSWILTLAFGYIGALFIENITLFHLCLAVAVIGYTALKFRRVYYAHIAFLIGALLGAATLFTNPCYRTIADDADFYRHVTQTVYESIIYCVKNANQLLDYLVYENILFCLILTALTVVLIRSPYSARSSRVALAARINLGVHIFLFLFIAFLHFFPDSLYTIPCTAGIFPFLVEFFFVVLALCYFLTIILAIWLCVPKTRQFRMLMPLFCVPVVIAPVLFVDPIGPRCAFAAYVLLMVFTLDFYAYIRANIATGLKIRNALSAGLSVAAILQVLLISATFLSISKGDMLRTEYTRMQADQNSQTVYIFTLPHSEMMHNSTPEDWNGTTAYYKAYHGLDPETELQIVSLEELEAHLNSSNIS